MGTDKLREYKFSVVIEKDIAGYFALCPELQGCYTQEDSHEEAIEYIKYAINFHIKDSIESGEKIQQTELVNLTMLEVVA